MVAFAFAAVIFIVMVVFVCLGISVFAEGLGNQWYAGVTSVLYFVISVFLIVVVRKIIYMIKTEFDIDMHEEI